jgi:hypothetical protein
MLLGKAARCAIVLLLLTIGSGRAQDIGLGAGASLAKQNDHADAATGFEARMGFFGDNNLALLAAGGRYVADARGDVLTAGNYSLVWGEATLLAQIKVKFLQPYAGVGCGYYIADHDISVQAQNTYSVWGQKIEQDVQDLAGAHVRGGLQVIVSPLVSMYVDVKYIFLKPEVKTKVSVRNTTIVVSDKEERIDLSGMFVGIGVGLGM